MADSFALPRDILVVRGPDRKTWLDGLLTCSVATVAPGQAGYGLLLTKQGKIVSDVFLADNGTELFVGVALGRGDEIRQLLDRYLVMEDAELERAAAALRFMLLTEPTGKDGAGVASGTLELRGLALTVVVTDQASGSEASPAALLASHGIGTFGVDFADHDNPHEASLDRVAVSWTKGCYLGQEVVCMQDMRGKVKRRLVALEGGAELLEAASAQVEVTGAEGSVVGHVTSVHPAASGARLLASLATSALDAQHAFSVRGATVRVVS